MARIETRGGRTAFVRFDLRRCGACWQCLEKCPGVIERVSFLWHRHVVIGNAGGCTGCLKCVKACPKGAFSRIETAG